MPKVLPSAPTPGGGRLTRGRRVSTTLAEINVIPLVDVMLVLLIIFMVAAPMLQRGVEVNLPVASRSTEIASDRIFVNVPLSFKEDRRVFIGQDPVRIDVLTERMRQMISKISKRSAEKIKLYTDHQPIFDRFNISRQLEGAFSRVVHLKGGGYIVVDETEALVAIDVNTGRHKSTKDQDSTIVKVNLEAAEEICRQLRLRNMGGLIVLDFIDMKQRRDQQAVYQRMKEGLRRDKAKTHVLPISQLGLMEMTRQRHTESVRAAVYDDCPYCKGRGKVKSALTMSVEIQRKLAEILKRRQRDESDFQLRIVVNPTVLERLRTEDEKLLIELEKRYFGKLSFRADPAFHAEQFQIVNVATNEQMASVGG